MRDLAGTNIQGESAGCSLVHGPAGATANLSVAILSSSSSSSSLPGLTQPRSTGQAMFLAQRTDHADSGDSETFAGQRKAQKSKF